MDFENDLRSIGSIKADSEMSDSERNIAKEAKSPFVEFDKTISRDSLVLAWLTRDNTKPIRPKEGEAMHTRFGSFKHDSMISARYGMQLPSSSATKAGFIHLLHPTPELWSLSLPHRTQIVYTPDASFIVQKLRIRPGTRVIEAGTGSGSFTHAFARTVGNTGRIWTFEFHKPRFEMAKQEIEEHGLTNIVKCFHGDVCTNGFIRINEEDSLNTEEAGASAVFLDLPSPWQAIPNLKDVITKKRMTRICCFSPCMEQVQRTIESLQQNGWLDIEMIEISCKRWEARKEMIRKPEDAVERLRDIKRRRIEGLKRRNEKIKEEEKILPASDNIANDNNDSATVMSEEDHISAKRKLGHILGSSNSSVQANDSADERLLKPYLPAEFNPWGKGKRIREGEEGYEWKQVSKVEQEIKSHTSYLTFAYLPPPLSIE
ncbi:tRNA methyltransferase complex GCD14 subunit-domain-containing protein [Dipodascopsis uninucleata]